MSNLYVVLACAGKMLVVFALPLGLWAVCCAAIKSVSPGPHHQPGLKKGR